MRELKFRVWSEEDKEYRTDCKLKYLFTSPTGLPSTVYNDEGDRFDIEQYTGLKDKNGNEIYEGDIIRVFDLDNFEVKYHDGRWLVGKEQLFLCNNDSKVIGNIHENTDLLGGGALSALGKRSRCSSTT